MIGDRYKLHHLHPRFYTMPWRLFESANSPDCGDATHHQGGEWDALLMDAPTVYLKGKISSAIGRAGAPLANVHAEPVIIPHVRFYAGAARIFFGHVNNPISCGQLNPETRLLPLRASIYGWMGGRFSRLHSARLIVSFTAMTACQLARIGARRFTWCVLRYDCPAACGQVFKFFLRLATFDAIA